MRTLSVCLLLVVSSAPVWAQDADQDGVADGVDAFPCDPQAAASAYAPAYGTHGLLLFEDEWPGSTDFDFNDLVVGYNFAFRLDAAGQTIGLRVSLDVLALGGVFDNGLALHLPVPAAMIAQAHRSVAGGSPQVLTPRAQDEQAVLDLSPNLRELFAGQSGAINSRTDLAHRQGDLLQVDINFSAPVSLPPGAAPYDLFVYRAARPTHEIHTRGYCGTASMDQTLFGTGLDASSASRCFVDGRGLPFALTLPQPAPYPVEAGDIARLYPTILDFARSGGALAADFYLSPDLGQSYPLAQAPRFFADPGLPVDLSCAPAPPPMDHSAEIAAIVGSVDRDCALSYPAGQCSDVAASAIEQQVLSQLGRVEHSPLSCELWTVNVRKQACTLSSTTSVRAVFTINGEVIGTKCTGPGCGVDTEIYAPVGMPVVDHPLDGLNLPIQPDFFYLDGPTPLPGLTLDPSTAEISFIPTPQDRGTHRLKIVVLDIFEEVVEIDLLLHVVTPPPQPDGPVSRLLVQGAATQAQAVLVPDGPLAGKRLVFGASSDTAFVVELRPLMPASLHSPPGSTVVGRPFELTVVTGTVGLDVAYYDDSVDGLTRQDFYQNVFEAPAARRARPAFAQSGAAQLDANQPFGFTRSVDVSPIVQHAGDALTNDSRAAGITSAVANMSSVSYRIRPVGFRGVYYTHSFTGSNGATVKNQTSVTLPNSGLPGLIMVTKAQLDADPSLSNVPGLSALTLAERQQVLHRFHYFDDAVDYLLAVEAQTASRVPTCLSTGPAELRNGGIKVTISNFLDPREVAIYQLPLPLIQAVATLTRDLFNPAAKAKLVLSQAYGDGLGLDGVASLDQRTRHILRHEYGHALQGMALERSAVATFYLATGSHDDWLLESTAEAFALASAMPGDLSAPGPRPTLKSNHSPLGTYSAYADLNAYHYGGFFNLMPMPVQGGGSRSYSFDAAAMCRMFEQDVPRSEHFNNYLAQYGGVTDLATWYTDYRASLEYLQTSRIRGGHTVDHRPDILVVPQGRWMGVHQEQFGGISPMVLALSNTSLARVGVALLHHPQGHRPVRLRAEAYDLGPITEQDRLRISNRQQGLTSLTARVPSRGGPLALDTISATPPADVDVMRTDAVYDVAVNGSLGLVVINDLYSMPQTFEREHQAHPPRRTEWLFQGLLDVDDQMGFEIYPVVRLTGNLLDGPGNPFSGQVRVIASNIEAETTTKRFLGRDLSTSIDASGYFSLEDVPFDNFSSNKRQLTIEVTCPSGGYGAGGSERLTVDWVDQGNGPVLHVNERLPSLRCSYGGTPLATDVGWTAMWRWGMEGFVTNRNACVNAIATFAECMQIVQNAPGQNGEVLVSTTFVGMSSAFSHDYQQVWRRLDGTELVNGASCYSRTYCLPRTP